MCCSIMEKGEEKRIDQTEDIEPRCYCKFESVKRKEWKAASTHSTLIQRIFIELGGCQSLMLMVQILNEKRGGW